MATTTKKRWADWTDEEKDAYRAERKAADQRLRDEADKVLADPEQVLRLIETLMNGKLSAHVLGLSIRNQCLLVEQAHSRGIPLSDVKGKRGWRELGRGIRGQGLRITARMGSDEEAQTDDAPPAEQAEAQGGDGEEEGRPRFRMISVWDHSQTVGPEQDEPAVPAEPERILRASLVEQVTRRGWRVVQDGPDDAPRPSNIDYDATTIALQHGWSGRDCIVTLALGLAQILTADAEAAQQRRASRAAS
jgi:hypothetical protein